MNRVLLINLEFDCAGVSWALRNALNSVPNWSASSVIFRTTPMAPNSDFKFLSVDCIAKMALEYDILHFNNWIWTHRPGDAFSFAPRSEYGIAHPFEHLRGKRKFVFHFHGGAHQLRPQYWVDECARMDARILKCDPISPIPGATWLPNVLNLDTITESTAPDSPLRVSIMGALSDNRRNNGVIRHSLNYLSQSCGMEYSFFDSIPYAEALRFRSDFNVSIDNLTQGFVGMWSWESLALGQAVMARLDPDTLSAYAGMFGSPPPIINTANIDHIGKWVAQFQSQPSLLSKLRSDSRAWALKHYTPGKVVRNYIEFYKS